MDIERKAQSQWGYVFEIAVKRGVLAFLLKTKMVNPTHPALQDWQKHKVGEIQRALISTLHVFSETDVRAVEEYCNHLLVQGYGLGWTVMRTWVHQLHNNLTLRQQKKPMNLIYLWAPFTLPNDIPYDDEQRFQAVQSFWDTMSLPGKPADEWGKRGMPANADFLMQLRLPDGTHHLLCLEFSLNAPFELRDFRREESHLDELCHYVRLMESRSIFSRINAEVSGEHFALSKNILSHINAFFSQRNKSFNKLWQGASYLTEFVRLLQSRDTLPGLLHGHVLAITSDGLEGMSAPLFPNDDNPKTKLIYELGGLYKQKRNEYDREAEIRQVFNHLCRAMPDTFRKAMQQNFDSISITGEPIDLRISEDVDQFINPVTLDSLDKMMKFVKANDAVNQYFGQPPRQAIEQLLSTEKNDACNLNLRDLHNTAVRASIAAAKPGELNILALEGNPGIGKTFAVMQAMRQMPEGFLFIYISPRVGINDKVVTNLSQEKDILALTSNAIINQGAPEWYKDHQIDYAYSDLTNITNAVTHNSPEGFIPPKTSTLYLTPEQAQEIDDQYGESGLRKHQLDCAQFQMQQQTRPGVMRTLGKACRNSLGDNHHLCKIVLTASIQGYKEIGNSSTVEGLFKELFPYSEHSPKGLKERRRCAQRMPNIVVMIDEITGDSAGTPLVHAFVRQLREQFIYPFRESGESSPLKKLILVIADASLGNESVMQAYLNDTHMAPEKVMVSPSTGGDCFRIAHSPLTLDGKKTPALHLMANSFPAGRLKTDYVIRLSPIRLEHKTDGSLQRPREAIREQAGDEQLRSAVMEIFNALDNTPEDQQVILFAQDKRFLRELQETLFNGVRLEELNIGRERPAHLRSRHEIAIYDQSVHPKERRRLMTPEVRDSKKLWLMTSSGSRGVDFPQATTIIAFVPRFSVESGLMEIAQLIYRGRGENGDCYDRRLVMLIHDYVIYQAGEAIEFGLWQRQRLDLISMLMLLRATILTRIQGDAGIPRQNLAVVPVGRIGVEDIIQTMSQTVADFLKEGGLLIADSNIHRDIKNIVQPALEACPQVLPELDINAIYKPADFHGSITCPTEISSFFNRLTRASSKVLDHIAPWEIPEYLHCMGPVWLEDWTKQDKREQLHLKLWDKNFMARAQKLNGLLYGIIEAKIPAKLKRLARDLKKILDSEILYKKTTDSVLQQSIVKKISSGQTWSVWPVDYPRFYHRPTSDSEDSQYPKLTAEEDWRDNLAAAASLNRPPAAVHPAIPVYDAEPFVNVVMSGKPINFEHVLDERYFGAGMEFNLLNVILWGNES